MVGVLSKHATTKKAAVVSVAVGLAASLMYHKYSSHDGGNEEKIKKANQAKPNVSKDFLKNLTKILRILIPSPLCEEVGFMALVAVALVCRTYADVWMIRNGTAIESAIIGRDVGLFKRHLLKYLCAMPAISLVNNLLKYGLSELKLAFRSRLTKSLYDKYLNGFTFYKLSNLDNRISNADHLLSQDVEKFCNCLVELYSNVSKPVLDIFLYVYKLATTIGFQGPAWMIAYLFVSGTFLTRLRKPLAKMTVREQQLEAEFRHINSRLITNSEEIAFYQGQTREKETLLRSFSKMIEHLRVVTVFRFSMGIVDNITAKYIATLVGYLVVSRPFLSLTNRKYLNASSNELLEEYYTSGRMLVKLAEAIGRLALAGREMTRLAGFTSRITEFVDVLNEVSAGKYSRTLVSDSPGKMEANKNAGNSPVAGSGNVYIVDNIIRFERVPLVTPNGDLLIPELNFEVRSGMNVLVCGPNGCGKSSLFRTLGELWPVFGGTLVKPHSSKLFYIPQRPYMTVGTLRDQIIYPHTQIEMLRRGFTNEHLLKYLELVSLEYILEREGGWDAVQDWMDVLSGGEKQRVAMARLFYHQPQFAILDECTSAVSVDVEGKMYQYCRKYCLQFDGRGAYEFKEIKDDTVHFGS